MTHVISSPRELSHAPGLAQEGVGKGCGSMEEKKKQVLIADKG